MNRPAPALPIAAAAPDRRDRLAALARALGHPARIRIVELLMRRTNCVGGDIVGEVGLAASTISEHLRILKEAGVVIGEIARPRVCYTLDPAALAPLAAFLGALAHAAPPPLAGPDAACCA